MHVDLYLKGQIIEPPHVSLLEGTIKVDDDVDALSVLGEGKHYDWANNDGVRYLRRFLLHAECQVARLERT
jgi:hypothetical protein